MNKPIRSMPVSLVLLCVSALAKDPFDRPQLPVARNAASLTIAFADAALWDGKRIPRAMQCKPLGGDKPTSPSLLVTGLPEATQNLVVYFANPRIQHNHGLFKVTAQAGDAGWTVPAVRSGANSLPSGVEIFDGGSTWGKAYSAPCPDHGTGFYTVTVYALDAMGSAIGIGSRELGYAP